MGEKLDLRMAKFHIIGTSEPAPVVGSISERKDTLFIKQVSATEFEVFASDDKGQVLSIYKHQELDSNNSNSDVIRLAAFKGGEESLGNCYLLGVDDDAHEYKFYNKINGAYENKNGVILDSFYCPKGLNYENNGKNIETFGKHIDKKVFELKSYIHLFFNDDDTIALALSGEQLNIISFQLGGIANRVTPSDIRVHGVDKEKFEIIVENAYSEDTYSDRLIIRLPANYNPYDYNRKRICIEVNLI